METHQQAQATLFIVQAHQRLALFSTGIIGPHLHLDTPYQGLALTDAALRERLMEASLQARSHLLHLGLRALRSGLRMYFRDLLQDISRLSREGLSSKKRLHDLRKNIKKVHYNLLVILETNPSLSLPAEPVQALENAQNLLGKWHDQHLAFREAKDMSDAPKLLLRQLRQEERICLQEVRIALVQLPPQVECLLQEAEHMLAPKPTAC